MYARISCALSLYSPNFAILRFLTVNRELTLETAPALAFQTIRRERDLLIGLAVGEKR